MLFLSFSFNIKKSSSQLIWLIFVSTSNTFSYKESFSSFRKDSDSSLYHGQVFVIKGSFLHVCDVAFKITP